MLPENTADAGNACLHRPLTSHFQTTNLRYYRTDPNLQGLLPPLRRGRRAEAGRSRFHLFLECGRGPDLRQNLLRHHPGLDDGLGRRADRRLEDTYLDHSS